MNTLLISVNADEDIVGYDEADYIMVFEMETRKVISRFRPSQVDVLEEVVDSSESCILVTSNVSEERLLEIEDYGVKVIIVARKNLHEFLNEIF